MTPPPAPTPASLAPVVSKVPAGGRSARPEPPADPQRRAVFDLHAQALDAARAEERHEDRVGAWIANGRAVSFLGALGVFLATWLGRLPSLAGNLGGLGLLAVYVALAIWHGRVLGRQERARVRQGLSERGMARTTGAWHAFADKGERHLEPEHLFAGDLDVFGSGSIFQLVDETGTRMGEDVLAAWLKEPAPVDVIRERQGAIQELATLRTFRHALIAECRLAARNKADPGKFIAWAEGGPYLDHLRWMTPFAWVLPVAILGAYVLGDRGVLPEWSWWLPFFGSVALLLIARNAFRTFFERITAGEGGFVRFGSAFAVVEGQQFQHPYLKKLARGLETSGPKVSERLHRFERLLGFAELRRNQLHPLINAFTLWDVHWLLRLDAWRRREATTVRAWFAALSEFEALGSLAALHHDRPQLRFPEVTDGPAHFVAEQLGHPLLEDPVLNDVTLLRPASALMLTGSNMSGKTTLVRAMGANAVLAMAGAPVCARTLRLSRMRVLTSMRVKDSLERGVSYFYAEVLRLRAVLDGAQQGNGRAMFLLDEILLGTNTRERQLAARRMLELLLETGAIGAVTTHDLALATLADDARFAVRNHHFRDALVDGKMSFDYRLREGVVDTTNALRVLEMAGIPMDLKGA